jgi:predicted nucleic acid-binding protein
VERTSKGRILVVADTSFLVNFLTLDRMDILRSLRIYAFHVPNHVVAEVEYAEQLGRLEAVIAEGTVTELEIVHPAEIALYDELRRLLGDGEAACLAVAATRRWVVATDEKRRLRREIFERLGENICSIHLGPSLQPYVWGSSQCPRLRRFARSWPGTAS